MKLIKLLYSASLLLTTLIYSLSTSDAEKYLHIKKKFKFSFDPIDVVIPVHEKDVPLLSQVIEGIKKNCQQELGRIIVISKERYTNDAEWFDERKFPFRKKDVVEIFKSIDNDPFLYAYERIGWYYQQLLKLYAWKVIPKISSNILVLDSDTIFLKKTNFQTPKGAGLLNIGDEHNDPYFEHGQRLLPGFRKVMANASGVTHHMLFQVPLLEDLFNTVESYHQCPFWQAFLKCVNPADFSGASEYEIYFNYALMKSTNVKTRRLKWTNADSHNLKKYIVSGYNYVSLHSYLFEPRRENPAYSRNIKYSILFVHIGESLPPYTLDSIEQARLFNENCLIYLIASPSATNPYREQLRQHDVLVIDPNTLIASKYHNQFKKSAQLSPGLFMRACERFFYIEEFMRLYNAKNIFHFENDNMIYVDLSELLSIFQKNYQIAAVFDNDKRCIPSFMYLANSDSIKFLPKFIYFYAKQGLNDMQIFPIYKAKAGLHIINHLPIIFEGYHTKYPMKNALGNVAKKPELYYTNFEQFNSIFDGAAIGQYIGGIDPINGESKPGFINESCLINPSHFTYEWKVDELGRKVPYLLYKNKKYRINNLHIHSKNLKAFKS